MKHILWGVALSVIAGSAISACDEGCTDVGCESGVVLNFSPSISDPGLYRISVEQSDQDGRCEILVPADASGAACGPFSLYFGEDGAISAIKVPTSSSLSLIVQRNEDVPQVTEVRPEFIESEPNGPDCGVCSTATEVITLR